MKQLRLLLAVVLLLAGLPLSAQLVSTSPVLLQQSSTGVVLTYHADSPLGNKGLANLSSATDVYAHIGVLTNLSSNTGDWKYVVAPWPEAGNAQTANTPKNRLTRVAANTYTLNIDNIRTYFGITNASERVTDIAIVFRT
ncbi:MAG: hypothetical protein K2L16_10565, partial [Muribaculaceae bacterium]|nr:hypothetical protein [Muribaculaceae bacterium]